MARRVLTAKFVESVKVESRTDYWDDVVRGLVLRVSPSGVKSWTVVYTRASDGGRCRLTLGKYPVIALEKARALALKAMVDVTDGNDPAGDKRTRRDAMTVADLGALYLDKWAKRHKRTWAEDERVLEREVYPRIGALKANAVRRRDLLDIIEAKADQTILRNGRRVAKLAQSARLLDVIRRLFNWAVESDYLEASPAMGIKRIGRAVRRDRVLADAEVRTVWESLPTAALLPETKDILRLLFLTGQRSGEVAGMRRGEVDADRAVWTISASRAKNGEAHEVPLSPTAMAIVAAALDRAGEDADAPLFAPRSGAPIESNAIAQGVRKRLQGSGAPWTPHDIRRTVATGMAEIDIAPHVIEMVLNHVSGFKRGVAGTYNRSKYEAQKRRALDMWGERLDAIVTGRAAKVVAIGQGHAA